MNNAKIKVWKAAIKLKQKEINRAIFEKNKWNERELKLDSDLYILEQRIDEEERKL